ncbi:MAG: acyl-CoA dehydrogenase [Deinococcales bacterium]
MKKLRRELEFLLYECLGAEELFSRERYLEHSRETADDVLDMAQRIAENLLAPHNVKGDREEPHFDGERVHLIPETKVAWEGVARAGFIAATFDHTWGGIQLPEVFMRASMAMFSAANIATTAYPFLTIGVANLIEHFASDNDKKRFLPALLSGRFSGTMALTEAAQGSSLADITTIAKLQPDGSYQLKGQKIYISGGDHEFCENIIHMVLAKIEGSPAGVKGISLFICPKFLLNEDGSLGQRNDVQLAGLLHKMGYRNTVNTVLSFGEQDNCVAYLVGEPHKGLHYMFQMMNEARIGVGLGAAALAYAGFDYSLYYAKERLQGRFASNKDPLSPQVPIIEHGDVKRMLLAQKSYAEGSLALCLYASRLVDDERTDQEGAIATELLDFLTPMVKSWPSRYGLKANELAIQVLGGAGYIREYPVEQYYRDNRINPIHEGTEGIQALDLLGRKLPYKQGKLYQGFLARIKTDIQKAGQGRGLSSVLAERLIPYLELHQQVSDFLLKAMAQNIDLALANASEYLDFSGRLTLGWLWLLQVRAAELGLETASDKTYYQGKLQTAQYHFDWEMPQMKEQAERLMGLNSLAYDMKADWF